MVAKPTIFVVQRRDQQVALGNRLKPFHACVGPSHGLAQRHAQPVENRGANHELNHLARQAIEQFPEIRANGVLDAGEIAHVLAEILVQLNRGGGNYPQGGRPAIGFLTQQPDVRQSECAGTFGLDKLPRFFGIESQGRSIDFQQQILCTQ